MPHNDKWDSDIPRREDLKLMYLEGDGARSFSELVILKNLMSELKATKYHPDEVVLPCNQFDMIGGRGTGGLFAIMFARLGMSVDEVMDEFSIIMKHVYTPPSLDRRSQLKRCLEEMFIRKGLNRDIILRAGWQEDDCAAFARAVHPGICFRSYPSARGTSDVRVIDAMLETCAPIVTFAPTNTTSIQDVMLEFVLEVRSLYKPESMVKSLLSLGSGHFGLIHIILPTPETIMNNTALEIISNSEVLAERMQRRMRNVGLYFRFSIEHGMQTNEPGYSDDIESINAQALNYLDDEEVRENVFWYIDTFNDEPGWINLNYLVQAVRLQDTTGYPNPVAPSIEQYHILREAVPEDGLTLTGNKDRGQIMIKSALGIVIFLALFHVIY